MKREEINLLKLGRQGRDRLRHFRHFFSGPLASGEGKPLSTRAVDALFTFLDEVDLPEKDVFFPETMVIEAETIVKRFPNQPLKDEVRHTVMATAKVVLLPDWWLTIKGEIDTKRFVNNPFAAAQTRSSISIDVKLAV